MMTKKARKVRAFTAVEACGCSQKFEYGVWTDQSQSRDSGPATPKIGLDPYSPRSYHESLKTTVLMSGINCRPI